VSEHFCLVDSNILLRWLQPLDPGYAAAAGAVDALARRAKVLCYTSQNVAEFWNVCTRPLAQNGYGLLPEQTHHRARIFETRLRLLPDSMLIHEEWSRMIVSYRVAGVQVHDTRLAAAMDVHGVKDILTRM
jgi:hypothetical protein